MNSSLTLLLAVGLALASGAALKEPQLAPEVERELADLLQHELALLQAAAKHPSPLLGQAKVQEEDPEMELERLRLLCKPCKAFFGLVKVELQNVHLIEKKVLEPVVRRLCHEKLGKIEQLENLCRNLADNVLGKLADWIQKEGNKIEPERTCLAGHFC